MKYTINVKHRKKNEKKCVSLRNDKLTTVYNSGYCILRRSERVKRYIMNTTHRVNVHLKTRIKV